MQPGWRRSASTSSCRAGPTEVPDRLEAYLSSLEPLAGSLGSELGPASWDDDDYPQKLERVLAEPPAAVSFTFGVPEPDAVRTRCSERDRSSW